MRWLAAAGAIVVATLTGCTGGTPDYVPPSTVPSGASVPPTPVVVPTPGDGEGPVGAKWDWGRFDAFEPYVRQLSGGATFYELVWCQVEKTPGDRNWAILDRIASRAERAGVELMLKVRVGQCWATGQEGEFVRGNKAKTESSMPRSELEYTDFVTEAVRRYSARGVRVWAVENEVNSPTFWAGTAAQYERLVATAARTVRSLDPEAVVVDAGLSSTSYGVGIAQRLIDDGDEDAAVGAWNTYYSRRFGTRGDELIRAAGVDELRAALAGEQQRRNADYLAATIRLLDQGVVDVRQVHFYEDASAADLLTDYVRETTPANVPVELWEVGSFVRGAELSQEEQVTDLVVKVSLFLAAGMRKVIWLPLIPNPDGRNADEPRSGLLAADASVRPLGEVYARFAADARAARAAPVIQGDVRGVALTKEGKSVAYVWSTGDPVQPAPGMRVEPLPPGSPATEVVGNKPVRVTGASTPDELWKDSP
ncbi:hypothetical protein ACOCJ7_14035 [Knoellia sp. CPCC 206453]|uniref:hypothetical protein n=1 Tax=Knoellia pratensis TaxID=3404796 RepID=UPI0036238780